MTDNSISAWSSAHYNRAKAALHTFDSLPIGIVPDSGAAGDQEDFGWHAEMLDPVGCETNRLAAASWSKWPCHHLEHDGSPADPAHHPGVMLWKGRAHMAGPDRLGKQRDLTLGETAGWSGPDDEHWTISRLYADAITTGCPALQEELAQHARMLIWDCSRTPGWFTSGARAARSRGWRALAAVRIYDALNDRELASRCTEAVVWHALNVWLPKRHRSGFTDVRLNDPRLGPGELAMLWQEAVYAYGMDRLAKQQEDYWGKTTDSWALSVHAHELANAIFKHGYREIDGAWVAREYLPLSPDVPMPPWKTDFNYFGMALAPAVLLRHRPDHPEARRCIDWLVKNAPDQGSLEWIAPEVVR